jgi:hypothetical protein
MKNATNMNAERLTAPKEVELELVSEQEKLQETQLALTKLAEINKLHAEIGLAARTSLEKAVRIGELLEEIKNAKPHGEWLPWLKVNVPFSRQTADNYRHIYAERDKLLNVSNLSQAYRLLDANEPIAPKSEKEQPAITPRLYAHPITYRLPESHSEQMIEMSESLKSSGLIDPITLCDGLVLDGWRRYVACYHAQVPHRFSEYAGERSFTALWRFISARNKARFTEDQWAMIFVCTCQDLDIPD